ncbi:hypothetical protein [Dietzia sp. 179-F 9C3 NHS]|uniref:hypothetical protein n=1 Tax=Dietzia sp. 179-F 9C3 NHS TaxID=3374295 RepID=UPI0038791A89
MLDDFTSGTALVLCAGAAAVMFLAGLLLGAPAIVHLRGRGDEQTSASTVSRLGLAVAAAGAILTVFAAFAAQRGDAVAPILGVGFVGGLIGAGVAHVYVKKK